MTDICALIADDEPLARGFVRSLLADHKDIQIVGEACCGKQTVAMIREKKPDLVFLDIQMCEMNGFEVIEAVGPEHMPAVVFITAFDQYAVRAFEVHAIDYLLKPFNRERFAAAVKRARDSLNHGADSQISQRLANLLQDYLVNRPGDDNDPKPQGEPYLRKIPVKSGHRVVLIDVERIDWIEAADDYVNLHCGGKTHLINDTMNSLESRLDPAGFVRIHRSTFVNLDRVKELRSYPGSDYEVILIDGTKLRLSRRRKEKLEALLGHTF